MSDSSLNDLEQLREELVDEREWHREAAMTERKEYDGEVGDTDDDRFNHGPGYALHCGIQQGLGEAIEMLDLAVKEAVDE